MHCEIKMLTWDAFMYLSVCAHSIHFHNILVVFQQTCGLHREALLNASCELFLGRKEVQLHFASRVTRPRVARTDVFMAVVFFSISAICAVAKYPEVSSCTNDVSPA